MEARRDDWLPDLLKDWADWYVGRLNSAYPDSSTLWRAVMSPVTGEAGSRPPRDVTPPPGLSQVALAMNNLLTDSDVGEAVSVVRAYYCFGEEKTLEKFKTSNGTQLKRRRMFDLKGRGEFAIRGFLKAH